MQVLAILSAQLSVHPRGRRCFDDVALDMVAKSVSSSSGDLRQALKVGQETEVSGRTECGEQ